MGSLSVPEAAEVLGLSRQRVVQLINAGRLEAVRLGRSWAIPEEGLSAYEMARRPGVRPMSARMARGMVDLIGQCLGGPAGLAWLGLPDRERSRLRRKLDRLRQSTAPAALMRAWLSERCGAQRFSFQGEAGDLYADPRLAPGGAAHPDLGLAGGELMEPHVADDDRDAVVWDLLLVPAARGNVLLRSEPSVRVDLAACLADVADAGGGRNDKTVSEILERGCRG